LSSLNKEHLPNLKDLVSVSKISNILVISLLSSIIQILLGTQIREAIDEIANMIADRNLWIDNLGISFYIHRSFSLAILALHIYLAYLLFKSTENLKKWAYLLVIFIFIEIVTGAAMAYLAIPAFLQPIHLTLATVIVGVQFWVYLLLNVEKWQKIS
jgi:cytochrome c oxidase assembly protein subunit 15